MAYATAISSGVVSQLPSATDSASGKRDVIPSFRDISMIFGTPTISATFTVGTLSDSTRQSRKVTVPLYFRV